LLLLLRPQRRLLLLLLLPWGVSRIDHWRKLLSKKPRLVEVAV
jgi:hypothetical protein